MQYKVNKPLRDFEFWSGAKDRAQQLSCEELDLIGDRLDEVFGDRIPTDTQINDFFWFNFESAVSLIGLHVDEDENIIRD